MSPAAFKETHRRLAGKKGSDQESDLVAVFYKQTPNFFTIHHGAEHGSDGHGRPNYDSFVTVSGDYPVQRGILLTHGT